MSFKAFTTFSKALLFAGLFASAQGYAQSNALFSESSRSGLEALRSVASQGWQLAADDPRNSDFSDVADAAYEPIGGECNFPCLDGDYQCFNRRRDCNLNHQMAVAMGEDYCPDKNSNGGGFQTAEATQEDLDNVRRTEVAIIGDDDRRPCVNNCLQNTSAVGRVTCMKPAQRRDSQGRIRDGFVRVRANFTVVGRSTISGTGHFNWNRSRGEYIDIASCVFETELGDGTKHTSRIELIDRGADFTQQPGAVNGPLDWSVLRLVNPVPEAVRPIEPIDVADSELAEMNLLMISYARDKDGKQRQTSVDQRAYVSSSDSREIIHYFDTYYESSGAPLLVVRDGRLRSVCTHVAAVNPSGGPNVCIRNSPEMLAAIQRENVRFASLERSQRDL